MELPQIRFADNDNLKGKFQDIIRRSIDDLICSRPSEPRSSLYGRLQEIKLDYEDEQIYSYDENDEGNNISRRFIVTREQEFIKGDICFQFRYKSQNTRSKLFETFRNIWFFSKLDRSTQDKLIDLLDDEYLQKDHVLVQKGQPQKLCYFFIQGEIQYFGDSDQEDKNEVNLKEVEVTDNNSSNDQPNKLFSHYEPTIITPVNLLYGTNSEYTVKTGKDLNYVWFLEREAYNYFFHKYLKTIFTGMIDKFELFPKFNNMTYEGKLKLATWMNFTTYRWETNLVVEPTSKVYSQRWFITEGQISYGNVIMQRGSMLMWRNKAYSYNIAAGTQIMYINSNILDILSSKHAETD